MEKLLYSGKAKQMWQTDDPAVLRVVYLDQATALNGKQKDHFAGKGQAAEKRLKKQREKNNEMVSAFICRRAGRKKEEKNRMEN